MSPCEQLNSTQAIQLDEMYHIPLFDGPLKHVATKHGPPSMILFKQSLRSVGFPPFIIPNENALLTFLFSFFLLSFHVCGRQMQLDASPVSAMVVSRNTGTTVCLKLRKNSKDVFLVLDFGLAPPEHGATTLALVVSTSLEQTAARLSGILPLDNHLVTHDRQWQAQLFANCRICIFTPAEGIVLSPDAEALVINESIALLKVMGEIDDRGRDLERERGTIRDRDRNSDRNQPSGSSRTELRRRTPFHDGILAPMTSRRHAGRVGGGPFGGRPNACVEELPQKTMSAPYEQTKRHCRIFFRDVESSVATRTATSPSIPSEVPEQDAYFECVICFENIPEEAGVRLLPCAHGFCRGCLAGHVCSKIEERKFPVFCPLCMVEQGNASPSGT